MHINMERISLRTPGSVSFLLQFALTFPDYEDVSLRISICTCVVVLCV